MEGAYQHLAKLYDILQQGVDTIAWADHVQQLDALYSQRNPCGDGQEGRPILLDLGCGTGSFCLEMARRGFDPIGIDASPAMLDQARLKAQESEKDDQSTSLFLLQDISRFELFGTVDLAVCLLDTINHLLRPAQVRSLFRLCANYLNPGAVLIFDLVTRRHLASTLGSQIFFEDRPEYSLFWQNLYQAKSGMSTAELSLFTKMPDDRYERQDEVIRERFYSWRDIRKWLTEAGLETVGRHGGLRLKAPATADERHFYVARRPLIQADCERSKNESE